jgi:hypothetical protein
MLSNRLDGPSLESHRAGQSLVSSLSLGLKRHTATDNKDGTPEASIMRLPEVMAKGASTRTASNLNPDKRNNLSSHSLPEFSCLRGIGKEKSDESERRKKKNRKCNGNHVSSIHPDPTKYPYSTLQYTTPPTMHTHPTSNLTCLMCPDSMPDPRPDSSSHPKISSPHPKPTQTMLNGVDSLFISLTSSRR